MHKGDVVAEAGSSRSLRSPRPRDVDVLTFLQTALTSGMVTVPELEISARAAGLLGAQQRISQAKPFKRAKITLGIRSIRLGFGPGGGWAWVLPPPARALAPETKSKEPVIRAEPARGAIYGIVGAAPIASIDDDPELPFEFRGIVGVPNSWLKGVARLSDQHPPRDVPAHRWQQFVDCYRFVVSEAGLSAPPSKDGMRLRCSAAADLIQ